MPDTIEIFISYSKQDKELRDGLLAHLRPLERQGIITWHDRQILPGTEWDGEIKARLNAADIILLLLSSDFLATDYCTQVEIPEALRRHEAGEATVMPVILRHCAWEYTPLAKIQAYPEKAKPIKSWTYIDEAYTGVTRGVYLAATEIKNRRSQQRQAAEEKLRQAEQLRQQAAEAERLKQEELERQRQAQNQEAEERAERERIQRRNRDELLPISPSGMEEHSPYVIQLCEAAYPNESIRLIEWKLEKRQLNALFRECRRGWYFQLTSILSKIQEGSGVPIDYKVCPFFLPLLEPDEYLWAKLTKSASPEDWYAMDEIIRLGLKSPGSEIRLVGQYSIGENVADDAMEQFGIYVPDEDLLPALLFVNKGSPI